MIRTFLDQNALIYLLTGTASDSLATRLKNAISSQKRLFILSSWHWIEGARTKDVTKAIALGEFMDSLSPAWLLERRDLQRLEVENDFFAFCGILHTPAPVLVKKQVLLASL